MTAVGLEYYCALLKLSYNTVQGAQAAFQIVVRSSYYTNKKSNISVTMLSISISVLLTFDHLWSKGHANSRYGKISYEGPSVTSCYVFYEAIFSIYSIIAHDHFHAISYHTLYVQSDTGEATFFQKLTTINYISNHILKYEMKAAIY